MERNNNAMIVASLMGRSFEVPFCYDEFVQRWVPALKIGFERSEQDGLWIFCNYAGFTPFFEKKKFRTVDELSAYIESQKFEFEVNWAKATVGLRNSDVMWPELKFAPLVRSA